MAYDDDRSERYRERNRGMFGYEGEGFMLQDRHEGAAHGMRTGFSGGYGGGASAERDETPGGYHDLEAGSARGWNIGTTSDRADPPPSRTSFRGRGPKNYRRLDDRIREDVCERLMLDHEVDATDIEVTVSDGIVTLEGTVNERRAKRAAEDVADSVRGVGEVRNHLRVAR